MADERQKVTILEVHKRGEWYIIKGVVDGVPISTDIHAKDIETRNRQDSEDLMKRALAGTAMLEKERHGTVGSF